MIRKLLLCLACLSLTLTACSPALQATAIPSEPVITEAPVVEPTATETPLFPLTLTDGLERVVEFQEPALRIVSLTPATTEILFAVGAGAQVVGRDMFSDYPAEAADVTDIGGSWGEYDSEGIVNLQPDLVLAGGINPPELVASLEGLGLRVFFLPNPVTLEELNINLELVGKLSGHVDEAASLALTLKDRVAVVDAAIAGITEKPTVYYELDATPFTAGPGTFVDLLISRAGGRNFGADMESAWAQVSLEQLLVADPDLIILGDSAYGETSQTVAGRLGWSALTAVKDGKIFPFDDNLVSRPGPRLVDGLEALARLIHPEVFKQ